MVEGVAPMTESPRCCDPALATGGAYHSSECPNRNDACEHDWQWLDSIQFVFDRRGNVTEYENAECTRCGLRAWKHGRMPYATHSTITESPTTGRS